MKKIALVTAIGTVTSSAIIKILKELNNFYIIGADINNKNEIATSLDVNEYYKFPYATREDYVSFAIKFCKEHHVNYYFAVIDKEVVNVSKNRDRFIEIGTKVCVVNYEFAEICHFKNIFGDWISERMPQIAIKEYKSLEEARQASYPLFIKPVEGVASTGCKKIKNYDELIAVIDSDEIAKKMLILDYIEGTNITVDCIRNKKSGQKTQIQRRELLRNSNGCGIAVEIFYEEKLAQICDTLMEELDLNGVANIELFDTEDGYKIIEINPRFSAGTMYSYMAGINTVKNAMLIVDECSCVFGEIATGAHFAERYEVYRMD